MSITPCVAELEKRMRPGVLSIGGFLGEGESLRSVIEHDTHTLDILDITFGQVADAIEDVLLCVCKLRSKLSGKNQPEFEQRENKGPEWSIPIFLPIEIRETVPHFTINRLPTSDVGYLVKRNLQVFIKQRAAFRNVLGNANMNA